MADLRRREEAVIPCNRSVKVFPSIGNIVVGLVAGFGVSLLIGLMVDHYFHEWLKGKLQQFANPKVRPSQIALRPNFGPGARTLDAEAGARRLTPPAEHRLLSLGTFYSSPRARPSSPLLAAA